MTNSKQIVVVEDDPSMVQAIKRLLRAAGFPVLPFASAEALLQSGATAEAACFVLDIHLPGLSGFELQQRMLDGGRRQPVIFITAQDEPSIREAAEASGAVACLGKPFPARTLLGAIRQALGSTKAARDATDGKIS